MSPGEGPQRRMAVLMRPSILVLAALLLLGQGALLPNQPTAAPPPVAPLTTLSFTPVADATLDSSQPDAALGTQHTLQVFYGGGPSEIGCAHLPLVVRSESAQ